MLVFELRTYNTIQVEYYIFQAFDFGNLDDRKVKLRKNIVLILHLKGGLQ